MKFLVVGYDRQLERNEKKNPFGKSF